jgi:uncharacterized membrane protein
MQKKRATRFPAIVLPAALMLSILVGWLLLTPGGFFGKLDAIGYSVCHRIAERSFFMFDRQLPLCSRCTGMYLGAAVGLMFLLMGKRHSGFADKKTLFILLGFIVMFAFDSINSFLQLLPNAPHLYTSHNWLRLLTGSGMGVAIPVMLVPIVNGTLWKDSSPEPIISSWKQLVIIVGVTSVLDATFLFGNPYILMLFAVLTPLTVVAILMLVYCVLWMMLLKKDARLMTLQQSIPWLCIGFTTALLQIGLMDAIRFAITGTWAGFIL